MDNFIKIIKKSKNARIPAKATDGAAGYDLFACLKEKILLRVGEKFLVPTGIIISLERNFAGFIFPRSGLGVKYNITLSNSVGVIDSDYRGEILVSLSNLGRENYVISPGDRIAQLVIMPVFNDFIFKEVESLDSTERGRGAFGSTGK